MNSAATSAFGLKRHFPNFSNPIVSVSRMPVYLPTSLWRNRNWRFKLLISIVSMSMTWMFLKPMRAKFFSSSHPSPPAPITRILHLSRMNEIISGDGSKLGCVNGPSNEIACNFTKRPRILLKRRKFTSTFKKFSDVVPATRPFHVRNLVHRVLSVDLHCFRQISSINVGGHLPVRITWMLALAAPQNQILDQILILVSFLFPISPGCGF